MLINQMPERKFLKGIEFKQSLVKSILVFEGMVRLERRNGQVIEINTKTGDTGFFDKGEKENL